MHLSEGFLLCLLICGERVDLSSLSFRSWRRRHAEVCDSLLAAPSVCAVALLLLARRAMTRASRVDCAGVVRDCLPLSRPLLPPTSGTSLRGTLPAWLAPLSTGHHDETFPGHGCAG